MRMNLKVPFAEKDEAKKLGARWDATRKIWYVENQADMAPFARWAPSVHDGVAGTGGLTKKSAPAKQRQSESVVVVGSAYVERARVCDCPPWEVCEKCEPTALLRRA